MKLFHTSLVATVIFSVLTIDARGQLPAPVASNTSLITAIATHGGNAVRSVTTLRILGQSASTRGTMPVAVSADLTGKIRIDYGNPVTRSVINTLSGSVEIMNGKSQPKPLHVGLFAQLDMLSVFGLLRFETGNVVWNDLGAGTVAGRPAVGLRADTGQTIEEYRRRLPDQADIRFDTATGLVSSITRIHYGENSLDVVMPVTYIFSDHRVVNNVAVPFRIEQYLKSTLVETITVTSIEFNPALSTGIFER